MSACEGEPSSAVRQADFGDFDRAGRFPVQPRKYALTVEPRSPVPRTLDERGLGRLSHLVRSAGVGNLAVRRLERAEAFEVSKVKR